MTQKLLFKTLLKAHPVVQVWRLCLWAEEAPPILALVCMATFNKFHHFNIISDVSRQSFNSEQKDNPKLDQSGLMKFLSSSKNFPHQNSKWPDIRFCCEFHCSQCFWCKPIHSWNYIWKIELKWSENHEKWGNIPIFKSSSIKSQFLYSSWRKFFMRHSFTFVRLKQENQSLEMSK